MIGKLGVSSKSERGKKDGILGFLFKKKKKNCAFSSGAVLKGKKASLFFIFSIFHF
jgi:hypothetical protein